MTKSSTSGVKWTPLAIIRWPLGYLGIAVGVLALWRLATETGISGDVFWQWAAGRWMLAHHRLMTHDHYSYTVIGHPWFTEEWGFEVLLAAMVQILGRYAFWILSAGVASLAVWLVAWRARLLGAGWTGAGLLAMLCGIGLTLFLRDRPQTLSYAFFALELWMLSRARQDRRWLAGLPVLLWIWANIHGSFLLGLVIIGLECVWSLWPIAWGKLRVQAPLPVRPLVWALVASLAATVLNPHGAALIPYALHVSSNPQIQNVIAEWQPPDFHVLTLLLMVVIPIGYSMVALAIYGEEVSLGDLVIAGALLVATLNSVRFMPYFLVAWCGFAASLPGLLRWDKAKPQWVTLPLLVVLGFAMLSGAWAAPGTPANTVPVTEVAWLKTHPGRVFTRYRWGDYCIWAHVPVFIDGRTDLYTGTGVLAQYLAIKGLTENPTVVFRDYRVRYVLWPPHTALATYLAHDSAWTLVYDAPNALIFEHHGSWGG